MHQHAVMNFELGQRYCIASLYRKGKPGRNDRGEFVTYHLTSGKVAFFPPDVDQAIQALHLGERESFSLTRRQNQGKIVWDIERLPQELQPTPPPSAPPDLARVAERPEMFHCTQEQPTAAPAGLSTRESQFLTRQLIAATEAVRAAQAYAISVGLAVEFRASDIRALAISQFIQQSRG